MVALRHAPIGARPLHPAARRAIQDLNLRGIEQQLLDLRRQADSHDLQLVVDEINGTLRECERQRKIIWEDNETDADQKAAAA